MNIVGKWNIAALMTFNEQSSGLEWRTAENIMADENAEDDMKRLLTASYIFKEDGKVLVIMPIPADASKEDVDEILAEGEIKLYDEHTMLLEEKAWKEENGKLFFDTGEKGDVLGEEVSSWKEIKEIEDGIEVETFRLVREM